MPAPTIQAEHYGINGHKWPVPGKKNHYSEYNIKTFLYENFSDNPVMRAKLQNLFDGVREQAYEQGRANGKEIAEDIIL